MSTDPISKYDSFGQNYCRPRNDTYPYITPSPSDMKSRYVLITGASKGLGREMALTYTRAGAAGIAIAARSSLSSLEAEIRSTASDAGLPEPRVVTLSLDVSDHAGALECGRTVAAAFDGRLDVLVLNAGQAEPHGKLLDQDAGVWTQALQTNVIGSFNCLQAFLPALLATDVGLRTVVALSSIGATLAMAGYTGYGPGKLALSRIMEHLMNEYGTKEDGGLLAYSIHPGGVRTDMSLTLPEFAHGFLVDTPSLTADALVWLTKERREWLAGRYVSVTWDMEEFLARRDEIEKRDLLKFRLAMGGEDVSKI